MITLLFTGVTLGFLGSFHCVGMCGPIALALPLGRTKGFKKLALILIYNLGRMTTYGMFGAAAGALGSGLVFAGFQQVLSLLAGGIILISVVSVYSGLPGRFFNNSSNRTFLVLRNKLSSLLLREKKGSLFTIGLLNGFLPCGFVYVATATSIATGNSFDGMTFMAVFGAGTVPAMLALPLFGNVWSMRSRTLLRKVSPAIITVTALLLIIRGLGLGIPFISPAVKNERSITCHKTTNNNLKNVIICIGPGSVHKK
jgi:sulfite exporter TauE/SafE